MVTLIGGDSATVTEVALVESLGSRQVNGSVEAQGGGEFFARFDTIPSFEFVVIVKGQRNSSATRASSEIFQRQSPTNLRASALTVTSVRLYKPVTFMLQVPLNLSFNGTFSSFRLIWTVS